MDPTAQPAISTGQPASSLVRAALGTWLRYIVPLALLSAIALSPVIAIAARVSVPVDKSAASATLGTGWALLAIAWPCQLMLVGAASAIAGARSPRASQLRALRAGLGQLVRAIVPCLAAMVVIAIGSLALAVPGLVLIVLLALTGASTARGLPGPITESIAIARTRLPAVALAVATMLALDAAIGLSAYRELVGALPHQPTPAQLAAVRTFVRVIAVALVVVSPLPACVIASIHPAPGAGR
ncbi:MAG TPA: hypothetical protein VFK02_31940 [Kofleriaceae bacterium]|nr:hypothetical protein [Kofleriaceae bacterium]